MKFGPLVAVGVLRVRGAEKSSNRRGLLSDLSGLGLTTLFGVVCIEAHAPPAQLRWLLPQNNHLFAWSMDHVDKHGGHGGVEVDNFRILS